MVFKLSPQSGGTWTETILHSFSFSKDGAFPTGGLIFDAAGNLYGTTSAGGPQHDAGTVFELSPKAGGIWKETLLHEFGGTGDGANPSAGLVMDTVGNLYGTAEFGGAGNIGIVFELSPGTGGWREKILHQFGGKAGDGRLPYSSLIFDAVGNLYGTTLKGGTANPDIGTVFELSPQSGGGWAENILHSFNPHVGDGSLPYANLVFDAAGNLFGTAGGGGGGQDAQGIAFELSPAAGGRWTEKVLHRFGAGTDGAAPKANLIVDAAGNLYGTTYAGGASGYGIVFKLTPQSDGTWTETILHSFTSNGDGSEPEGGLVLDSKGNLFGTTLYGGTQGAASGLGTVFEITP